jgi:hypothetical protein
MKQASKQQEKEVALPDQFVPQFWENEDGRYAIVRAIRERYETLKADCGIDSFQKDLLCQRAVFVSLQLETLEITAARTGKFNAGVYGQLVNTFLGLLKSLGIERKAKKVGLSDYVRKKTI